MDWVQQIFDRLLTEASNDPIQFVGIVVLPVVVLVVGIVTGFFGWVWKAISGQSGDKAGTTYNVGIQSNGGLAEAPSVVAGKVEGGQHTYIGAPPEHLTLHIDEYERRLEARAEEVRKELAANPDNRALLEAEQAEISRRLSDAEGAVAERDKRIAELEARLGNTPDEAAAREALDRKDWTAAKEAYERIEAETALDVKKNADAHYALGQIAEEEIRWADATRHYGRAAELWGSFAKRAEGEFAWRATFANLPRRAAGIAAAIAEHWRDVRRNARRPAQFDDTRSRSAGPDTGRYEEAEPLFREAMEITGKALGTDHPDYATQPQQSRGTCSGPPGGTRRPSRSTGRPSRSARRRSGRTIRTTRPPQQSRG